MGLAGGVGVEARPNREANGFDSREAAAAVEGGTLGRGRGGRGGFENDDAAGRGGSGRDG